MFWKHSDVRNLKDSSNAVELWTRSSHYQQDYLSDTLQGSSLELLHLVFTLGQFFLRVERLQGFELFTHSCQGYLYRVNQSAINPAVSKRGPLRGRR
jgi:hypothetical protein